MLRDDCKFHISEILGEIDLHYSVASAKERGRKETHFFTFHEALCKFHQSTLFIDLCLLPLDLLKL